MRSDAPVEERLNRVKQQLQQSSYKLTPQREATVRVLIENEKDHLSAEDVYLKVKDKAPEIGLATVYRTLELLAELKVVDKINFGDGVARFDLRKEGAKHFHHHLVCMVYVQNVKLKVNNKLNLIKCCINFICKCLEELFKIKKVICNN